MTKITGAPSQDIPCVPYFHDIVGHEELISRLRSYVEEEDLPHALLFIGDEGSETLPITLAFARYLYCEAPVDGDSCGKCRSCLQLDELSNPDFYPVVPIVKASGDKPTLTIDFMDSLRSLLRTSRRPRMEDWTAQLNTGNKQLSIYKDESDSIAHFLSLKTYQSEHKVVWVWAPEKMNAASANKLLKILEEPPVGVCFLMVTAAPQELLPTILSRLQRIRVKPIDDTDMQIYLAENYALNPLKRDEITHRAMGNIRMAEQLLSEEEGGESDVLMDLAVRILTSTAHKDLKSMRQLSDEVHALSRQEVLDLLERISHVVRESMALQIDPRLSYVDPRLVDPLSSLSPGLSSRSLTTILELIDKAQEEVRRNVSVKMIFFDVMLSLSDLLVITR